MAIQTKTNKNQEKALGYLNLSITDKSGNEHKIPCYIPINEGKSEVLEAMLQAQQEAEENGEAKAFPIVGTIHIAQEKGNIQF